MARNSKQPTVTFSQASDENGWIKGKVGRYTFSAKVYDEGSEYGINEGRVSKVSVWDKAKRTSEGFFPACILNYDRGWDIEPATEEAKQILAALLKRLEALPTDIEI